MGRGKKAPAVNIVKRPEGWGVIRDGAERASRVFETQQQAIDYGRPIARRDETELRVQDRHGKWRDSDSYGGDPHPPTDEQH